MSPIRPDLPSPRHAATHPVSTTSARVAQAAFFQKALAGVKTAQESVRAEAPTVRPSAPATDSQGAQPQDRLRRPGALLDIRV